MQSQEQHNEVRERDRDEPIVARVIGGSPMQARHHVVGENVETRLWHVASRFKDLLTSGSMSAVTRDRERERVSYRDEA